MQVYIYGAHVKEGYSKSYSHFEEIAHEGMCKTSKGILDLVNDKPTCMFEFVENCLKHVPYVGQRTLNVYSEYRRGKSKFRGIPNVVGYELWDRLMLMNDEVTWQWRTGSDLTYRFETISEAKEFFTWILMHRVDEVKTCSADADNGKGHSGGQRTQSRHGVSGRFGRVAERYVLGQGVRRQSPDVAERKLCRG